MRYSLILISFWAYATIHVHADHHYANSRKSVMVTNSNQQYGDVDKMCSKMPDNTLIGEPKDCRRYYQCVNSRTITFQCYIGYYFNKRLGYCIRGTCRNGQTPKCRESEMKRIPADCQAFAVCINGQWQNRACPSSMFFDSSVNYCRKKDSSPEFKCSCTEIQYQTMKDDHNCQNYYVCMEGKAEHIHCPDYHYFNDNVNACLWDYKGVCPIPLHQKADHLSATWPKITKNLSTNKVREEQVDNAPQLNQYSSKENQQNKKKKQQSEIKHENGVIA